MQRGNALCAPAGWYGLEPDLTYYFLSSNRFKSKAQLVYFFKKKGWMAMLIELERDCFEEGLVSGAIRTDPSENAAGPPFLRRVAGKDLTRADLARHNAKKEHADRVQERLLKIQPLLDRQDEILRAPNPEGAINRFATQHGLNTQRTRFWFFAYVTFPTHKCVLFPGYFNCGDWDRVGKDPSGPKYGRNSRVRSKQAGLRVDAEMIKTMIKSYKNLREEGKSKTAIYREALIRHFDAQVVTNAQGNKILLNSQGKPLMTYDQYWYQLEKVLGAEEIGRWRWGEARYRQAQAPHKGKFSASVSNLMERVEADAYQVTAKPVSVTGEGHLSNLVVARIIDVASGLRLGIGFSISGESSEAYDSAKFSMAIGKQRFGQIVGIEVDPATEWPSKGLSPHAITDRGPGVKPEPGRADDPATGAIVREITPSGMGQSKAIVESSQRRETQLEGPKTTRLSDKSVTEIAKQEIHRLLIENATADASGHMTPEMIDAGVLPTPLEIWNYLDARARNDAQSIEFDDAVRRFLPTVEVTLDRAGIWYLKQRYTSPDLLDEAVVRVGQGRMKLRAYIYPFAMRYLWVEIGDRLYEVKAELNLNDDESLLYRTHEQMKWTAEQMNMLQAQRREQSHAVAIEHQLTYREDTGKYMDTVQSVTTRPKRTQATLQEERNLKVVSGIGGTRT